MPLIIIAFVVIAIIVGYLGWKAEHERRMALAALAAELGFTFDPSRDRHHDGEYAQFAIFRRGHSRAAYHTLRGQLPLAGQVCPATLGDFTYKVTSGSGKNRRTTTYRFSYLIIRLPWLGVPSLLIRPEGLFDKLSSFFGFADINFESAEFSRQFYVSSADRRFAYDVITPRMMEFLLATRPPAIDIEHGRCCLSDGARCWSPQEFRERIRWIGDFFAQWPEHLTGRLAPLSAPAASAPSIAAGGT